MGGECVLFYASKENAGTNYLFETWVCCTGSFMAHTPRITLHTITRNRQFYISASLKTGM